MHVARRILLPLAALVLAILAASSPAQAMQIFVSLPDTTTITLDVEPADTIDNVKAKIQDQTGLPVEQIVLRFGDQLLEDNRTLSDYGIGKNAVLACSLLELTPTATPTAPPPPTPSPAMTCPPVPQAQCRQQQKPRRGRLTIDDWQGRYDRKDRVEFTWRYGEGTALADFGDPVATTSYALCVYDGSGALVFGASLAGGEGWRRRQQGFEFADHELSQSGVRRVVLRSRGATAGAAMIRIVGRGRIGTLGSAGGGNLPDLGAFPLAVAPSPLRAQLIHSEGGCWEGRYASFVRGNAASNTKVSRLRALND